MPRRCSVCDHHQRSEIDHALAVNRDGLRDIAGRFGLSKTALGRHKTEHLPTHLAKAVEAQDVASAGSLLEQMQALQAKTVAILEAATDPRTALAAVAQARGNVQLLAELTGKLATQPTVNVLISAEWVTVRSTLLDALQPFPAARAAVAARLLALQAGGDGGRGA
jgi:hypothetical protein